MGTVSLSHTFSLFSVEKESVFVFSCSDKKSKKTRLQPTYRKEKCVCVCVSSHIRVSTAGWASCPISVRPDMIRRQIASSSSLSGPWRLCSEVRKGLNADIVQHFLWYPGTTKIQILWKQASTNPAVETQTLGNITLKENEDCCCTKDEGEAMWAVCLWYCSAW